MPTGWETFGQQKPLEEIVRLPMVADSTVEVAVEIDTGLAPGMKLGWTFVGMDYCFREIAAPHTPVQLQVIGDYAITTQLCRGDAPATPVLLDPGDHDVIYDHVLNHVSDTAVGFREYEGWYKIRKPDRTQFETLYLMFGTETDQTDISQATVELFAILYYYLVDAPEIHGHNE